MTPSLSTTQRPYSTSLGRPYVPRRRAKGGCVCKASMLRRLVPYKLAAASGAAKTSPAPDSSHGGGGRRRSKKEMTKAARLCRLLLANCGAGCSPQQAARGP